LRAAVDTYATLDPVVLALASATTGVEIATLEVAISAAAAVGLSRGPSLEAARAKLEALQIAQLEREKAEALAMLTLAIESKDVNAIKRAVHEIHVRRTTSKDDEMFVTALKAAADTRVALEPILAALVSAADTTSIGLAISAGIRAGLTTTTPEVAAAQARLDALILAAIEKDKYEALSALITATNNKDHSAIHAAVATAGTVKSKHNVRY
jgi:hypothetical protein